MAIYTIQIKPVSRSAGHSATAKIAYNCRDKITDQRTGEIHKYNSRKMSADLIHSEITYKDLTLDKNNREKIWNNAELADNRSNSRTAREYVVALPKELSIEQNIELVREFARHLTEKYNNVADWAVHNEKDGNNNVHAHILTTTRQFDLVALELGEKTDLELDNGRLKKEGKKISQDQIKDIRKSWENIQNKHLKIAGLDLKVSCERKEERATIKKHLGKNAVALERKGIETEIANHNRTIENYENVSIEIKKKKKELQKNKLDLQIIEIDKNQQLERERERELRLISIEDEDEIIKQKQKNRIYIVQVQFNHLFDVARHHKVFFARKFENGFCYETKDQAISVYRDCVNVNVLTQRNIEIALDAAIVQFGENLKICGDENFKKMVADVIQKNEKYQNIKFDNFILNEKSKDSEVQHEKNIQFFSNYGIKI